MNEVNYLAVGEDNPKYFEKILHPEVISHYQKIRKYLNEEWDSGDRDKILSITGCLEKLSATIFQVYRLYDHQRIILKNAKNFVNLDARNLAMSLGHEEACYDFESLLFQCRSTLDILTWVITKSYKNKSNSFKKLRAILNDHFPANIKNQYLSILDQSKWLENFMITQKNLMKSIRDSITHYSSYNQRTEYVFNIVSVNRNEIILTDTESLNIPLFETTWELSKYLPFVVLNCISSYTINEALSISDCIPKWRNRATRISKYLESQEGSLLNPNNIRVAKSLDPDGFTFRTDNYTSELLDRKITLLQVAPSRKDDKIKEGWEEIAILPNNFILLCM
jgi:hypothetical protein